MTKITANKPSKMANKATGDCKVETYSVADYRDSYEFR